MAALIPAAAAATALMLSTGSSSGDLQSQISASQSAADSLRSQIAADTGQINKTAGGIAAARDRLVTLQRDLDNREHQLRNVQTSLIQTRDHLVELENRLHRASTALAANLVAKYEGAQPDVMSVILDAHGFSDLLERMNFLQRVGHQDAQVVGTTRAARTEVTKEVTRLAALEKRDRALTSQILTRRNDVAALQAALLTQQRDQLSARSRDSAKLRDVNNRLGALQRKAAAEAAAAARAAVTQSRSNSTVVSGLAINTGGMVQAPPGAPPQIGQVMAAGNEIATLPYIWGGGHGGSRPAATTARARSATRSPRPACCPRRYSTGLQELGRPRPRQVDHGLRERRPRLHDRRRPPLRHGALAQAAPAGPARPPPRPASSRATRRLLSGRLTNVRRAVAGGRSVIELAGAQRRGSCGDRAERHLHFRVVDRERAALRQQRGGPRGGRGRPAGTVHREVMAARGQRDPRPGPGGV